MSQNEGKQLLKTFSEVCERCLKETLLPFSIILKQTLYKAYCMKCGMNDAVKSAEVFPTSGTFDGGKECPEVKVFSSSW